VELHCSVAADMDRMFT